VSDLPDGSMNWLAARGLADRVDEPSEAMPVLPGDYVARVRALELALESTGYGGRAADSQKVLQRALDFHAFLVARMPADEPEE